MTVKKDVVILTHEYPPFRGGIGTYCRQLAVAAAGLGHKVTVYAPRYDEPAESDAPDGNMVEKRIFAGTFRAALFPLLLFQTWRLIRKHRGSQILAADWPFVAACGILRRIMRFEYKVMVHGSEILFFKQSKAFDLACLSDPFFQASEVLANSEFTLNLLKSNYPHTSARGLKVTHLGVNTYWGEAEQSDTTFSLDRWNIPPDRKVILSVGRLHPRKGQGRCIRALAGLDEVVRSEIVYVVVGPVIDAAYATELRELASKAQVPIVFTGAISDAELRFLYHRSTAFCLPSQTRGTKVEGFGLVFLEAGLAGLPSIAVDEGAVPEVIVSGETGLLVPPDDQERLTQALKDLVTNAGTRNRLAQAAKAWAEQFTWQACAKKSFG